MIQRFFIIFLLSAAAATAGTVARPVDEAQLQAILDDARSAFDIKGISAALILPDGSLLTATSGFAGKDVAVTEETVFDTGSITKTFTAAILLQLVAEGRLSLEDPLSNWMPDFSGAERIRIRQLLNHTSGLYDSFENPAYLPALIADPAKRWTPEDNFRFMKEPYFEPGEGFRYSNPNYLILGKVICAISGRSMAEQYRKRLFEPLSLTRTFFAAEEPIEGSAAHAYIDLDRDGSQDELANMANTSFSTAAWTAGAIWSTPSDLVVWVRALYEGSVLPEAQRKDLLTTVRRPDGMSYGLGVLVRERGERQLLGHGGNSSGFSGAVWHAPDRDITVAVLTNRHLLDATPIADRMTAAVLGEEAEPSGASRSSAHRAALRDGRH